MANKMKWEWNGREWNEMEWKGLENGYVNVNQKGKGIKNGNEIVD